MRKGKLYRVLQRGARKNKEWERGLRTKNERDRMIASRGWVKIQRRTS